MAHDLVSTWNPRVGAAGDDLYNVPGAYKLDGTLDTGDFSDILFGDASSYSTIPTIAEIAAGIGINQVIALVNRRIKNYNAQFSTSTTAQAYLTGTKAKAADIASVNNKINAMRQLEGLPSYTFPTSEEIAARRIRGTHLAHWRKALAISGILTPTIEATSSGFYSGQDIYVRTDNPYATPSSESFVNEGFGNLNCGQVNTVTTTWNRKRMRFAAQIPDWLSDASWIVSASAFLRADSIVGSLDVRCYTCAASQIPWSLSPAYAGSMYHTDNDEGAWSLAGLPAIPSLAVAAAHVSPFAGSYCCWIAATADDVAGNAVQGYLLSSNAGGFNSWMTIDLGA